MTLPNHVEMLDKLYGKAKFREQQQQSDKRTIMTRLPTDPHPVTGRTMLTDLRALHAAFGTRAAWIAVDGETLLGTEPDRSRRAVPVKQHPVAGGEA